MPYSERLTPSPWIFLACSLLIPGVLLVLLPVSLPVAVVTAVVFFLGACAALLLLAPVIEVRDGALAAGRARIPLSLTGALSAHRGTDATAERGTRLDARAYLCIRGWVDPVVRVELTDPADPAPYWLLSTRRPEQLIAAIDAERAQGPVR